MNIFCGTVNTWLFLCAWPLLATGAQINDGNGALSVASNVLAQFQNVELNLYSDEVPHKNGLLMAFPHADFSIKNNQATCNIYLGGIDRLIAMFYLPMDGKTQTNPHIADNIYTFIVIHEAVHCVKQLTKLSFKKQQIIAKAASLEDVLKSKPNEIKMNRVIRSIKISKLTISESYSDTMSLLIMKSILDDASLTEVEYRQKLSYLVKLGEGLSLSRKLNAAQDPEHYTSSSIDEAVAIISGGKSINLEKATKITTEIVGNNIPIIFKASVEHAFTNIPAHFVRQFLSQSQVIPHTLQKINSSVMLLN
jgi:hypothetical protein